MEIIADKKEGVRLLFLVTYSLIHRQVEKRKHCFNSYRHVFLING
jgi:hypothetical protein